MPAISAVMKMQEEERCPISPIFESVDDCPEKVITQVTGEIPSWISGVLVRNGAGKFEFGDDKVNHWFDGSCIIQKFNIKDGQVTFQSRFIETEVYKRNCAQQRVTVAEFGTCVTPDPCASKFSRLKSWFLDHQKTDNTNVNVFKFGDALLASTDSPLMTVVSTELAKKQQIDFTQLLSLHLSSSHPHFESDGTMYIAGTSFGRRPKHHIVKVPPPQPGMTDSADLLSKAEVISTIYARSAIAPSYSHSFGMTENYFIYCETPVSLHVLRILTAQFTNQPVNTAFHYDPNTMALFHIIKKSTGEVLPIKFQAKGLFFFHMINCYEEANHIVVDLCSYSNFQDASLFTETLEEFRSGKWENSKKWETYQQHPLRIVFPLHSSVNSHTGTNLVKLKNCQCKAYLTALDLVTVEPERLLPEGEDCLEMPQIHYAKFNGKKYRYFYGTGMMVNQYFMNAIGKVDVMTKTSKRWKGTVNQYPSEAVFIPHPNSQSEDDGVLLATVCDTNPKKNDFLLILDAKTFSEIARAYVAEDVRIPYSFHGTYYET